MNEMRIRYSKDTEISINNPDFDVMRNTLNITMNGVIDEMIEKELNSGTVTLKLTFSTMKDVINDNNAPMGTRPAMNIEIGADVNYSIQSKGSCKVDVINKAAQKEIVMDDNGTHHIVSRDVASGQLSMFNTYDEYIDAVKDGKY